MPLTYSVPQTSPAPLGPAVVDKTPGRTRWCPGGHPGPCTFLTSQTGGQVRRCADRLRSPLNGSWDLSPRSQQLVWTLPAEPLWVGAKESRKSPPLSTSAAPSCCPPPRPLLGGGLCVPEKPSWPLNPCLGSALLSPGLSSAGRGWWWWWWWHFLSLSGWSPSWACLG